MSKYLIHWQFVDFSESLPAGEALFEVWQTESLVNSKEKIKKGLDLWPTAGYTLIDPKGRVLERKDFVPEDRL